MYISDPLTPTTLAVTGMTAAHGAIGLAVLFFAAGAAVVIFKQIRKGRKKD